jgi:hypothetical protein
MRSRLKANTRTLLPPVLLLLTSCLCLTSQNDQLEFIGDGALVVFLLSYSGTLLTCLVVSPFYFYKLLTENEEGK